VGASIRSKVVGSKYESMNSTMCVNLFADVDFIIFFLLILESESGGISCWYSNWARAYWMYWNNNSGFSIVQKTISKAQKGRDR